MNNTWTKEEIQLTRYAWALVDAARKERRMRYYNYATVHVMAWVIVLIMCWLMTL